MGCFTKIKKQTIITLNLLTCHTPNGDIPSAEAASAEHITKQLLQRFPNVQTAVHLYFHIVCVRTAVTIAANK